jgi:hypothetical protein
MATVTCARCGFEVEVTRTAGNEMKIDGDFTSLIVRCMHRKDNIIRMSDLDCPDFEAARYEAIASGRL